MDDDEVSARAMIADGDKFDKTEWQTRRNIICRHYQDVWTPMGEWQFTPRHGIAHVNGCDACKSYVDHRLTVEGSGSSGGAPVWKDCDEYKRDLIHAEWTLALEQERMPPGETTNAVLMAYIETLRQEN